MKILFAQSNYPVFLKGFYSKHSNWEKLSYEKIIKLWGRELFGNSNFYSSNFKKLHWQAWDVLIDDFNSQSLWAKEHKVKIDSLKDKLLKKLPFPVKTRIGAIDTWIFKVLQAQVKYYKPDIVYFHHLGLLTRNQINEIKKHTRLIAGQIASPLPTNKESLREFDIIISSFPHYVRMFNSWGIKSEYVKLCAEKTIPKKIGGHKRIYNISYVGAFTPHHSRGNKALEELAKNIEVNYWGYGENYLLPTSPIKKYFHGQAWGKDMYKIFAKSKIVVNRHINVAKDYANNLRMFETTLMGALLITDHKKNMNKFFRAGKEVVTYKSPEDLVRKVKYYLAHPKEARKIAEAGQKKTLRNHTYDVRMKELDKILRKYLEK